MIEDGVWLGTNVIVLSGVKIGEGAVIGAGAIVSKDIPPYAIAVGNPVRIIKYRFDQEIIKRILSLKLYSRFDLFEEYNELKFLLKKPLNLSVVEELECLCKNLNILMLEY